MTDTPKPLTDAELDEIEKHGGWGMDPAAWRERDERLVAEVRRQRALLKRIHEKGEPKSRMTTDECVWCGADRDETHAGGEPHSLDCPWLELEREVKG